jgi:mannose/cellobiose epimerase-like protein (N-acyl-D-glucosamine 2-epimerase family)|tara:strand:- start:301 stop:492 length:192 start_codon:yes stop_codon:yes gene_type:complete
MYEVFDPVTGEWLRSTMSKEDFEQQMKDYQIHYEFLDAELEIVTKILEQNVLDDFERSKSSLD